MSESNGGRTSRPGPGSALLVLLCTSPLAFLVGYFGGFDRGFTAWVFGGTIVVACTIRWNLRGRAGFWVGVVVLAALHVPLVIFVPWRYSGAAFLPIGLLDLAIDVGLLTLLAKFMKRKNGDAAAG